MAFKEYCKNLEEKIEKSYTEALSLDDAEKLAAEFLRAKLEVSKELAKADLDAKMRKTGVKTLRAALYLQEVQKSEKKPTETMLESIITSNELVAGEQESLDRAEVAKAELERLYEIYLNAHIYYRGVGKGRFE